MTNQEKFIGKGLTFPFVISANGRPELETGIALIRSSIRIILSWSNFRFFLGEFQSRIFELVEEQNDVILRGLVRDFSIEQINKWEKRIKLKTSQIIQKDNKLNLKITYEITSSKIEDSFIFPFYEKIKY